MKNNDMKNILLYLSLFLSLLSCNKPVTGKSGEEGIKVEEIVWDGVKRADITYQLLVYSFADGDGDLYGDFKGLKDRLDYIDALGASAIWLSPIHPSEAYHGYGVIDYERVNEKFGTEKDFKDFLDAAHARGIKVYLDFVLNHSATDCEWFKQACAGNPAGTTGQNTALRQAVTYLSGECLSLSPTPTMRTSPCLARNSSTRTSVPTLSQTSISGRQPNPKSREHSKPSQRQRTNG